MIIRGRLADILINIISECYEKFATKDRSGNTILYVKLLKTLYGLIETSLILYQKLLKDLETRGLKTNPYYLCVANKMINGSQFTLA